MRAKCSKRFGLSVGAQLAEGLAIRSPGSFDALEARPELDGSLFHQPVVRGTGNLLRRAGLEPVHGERFLDRSSAVARRDAYASCGVYLPTAGVGAAVVDAAHNLEFGCSRSLRCQDQLQRSG